MSSSPSPCMRTSKYHGGRRSGAPFTRFSRWWTLSNVMAAPPSRANSPNTSGVATSIRSTAVVISWRPVIISIARGGPARAWRRSARAERARHPGLVGQHGQPGVVEAANPAHLAVVAPRHDHEVARAIGEEALEGIAPHADEGPPPRGPLGARIEAGQEVQELADLRLLGGVDDDLVAHQRVPLPQGERRVEMARGEEHQGMHGPMVAGAPTRSVYDPGPMSYFRAGQRPPETSQNRR